MLPYALIALLVSGVCAGLFSGMMFALVFLLQPTWNRQSAAEYVADIQPFLRVGKGNRAVSLILFLGLAAPFPAAIGTFAAGQTARAVLIAAGWLVFALGALGVTAVFNLPTYNAIMALDARAPDTRWASLRQRFHWLNLARLLASFAAFVSWLVALVV
jgi:uncharacterized membrane protein